jgi:PAS domain S-box-containing protein
MDRKLYLQILLFPVLLIVLTAAIITAFNIRQFQEHAQLHIEETTNSFVERKKAEVRGKVSRALRLIHFHQARSEQLLKRGIQHRADNLTALLRSFHANHPELHGRRHAARMQQALLDLLAGVPSDGSNGALFVIDRNDKRLLHHQGAAFVDQDQAAPGAVLDREFIAAEEAIAEGWGSGFKQFSVADEAGGVSPRIVYFRGFQAGDFNWLIGVAKDLEATEAAQQQRVIEELRSLDQDERTYLFVIELHDLQGGDDFGTVLLSENLAILGQSISDDFEDARGNHHRRDYLKLLREQGQGFLDYWYRKPDGGGEGHKMSYFQLYAPWNWAVASGFYFDDLEREVGRIHKTVDGEIAMRLRHALWSSLTLIVLATGLSLLFAHHTNRRIRHYSQRIEELNQNLNQRVAEKTHALEESQSRLSAIIEQSPDPIFVVDGERACLADFNPAMCRLLGYTPDELKGMSVSDIDAEETPAEVRQRILAMRDRHQVQFTRPWRTKSGAQLQQEIRVARIELGGRPMFLAVSRDITERMRFVAKLHEAEQARAASAERLQLATQAASIGIWEWNIQDQELFWDEQMFRIYQCHPVQFSGRYADWSDRLLPEDFERVQPLLESLIEGRQTSASWRFRILLPNQEIRHIEAYGKTLNKASGEPVSLIGTNWDITQLMHNEQELMQAKERAESANHAKSAFLANMSHELRTPLNAVLGFAQILLQDQTLDAAQQRSLEAIRRGGDYLLLLINDILDLAKIEADRLELHPGPADPVSLFEQIAEQFTFRARQKGIAFIMEGLEALPPALEADEMRLRQVVMNLLANAVKFTEQGEVRLHLHHRDETLFCSVEDSGIGIAPDQLPYLFTPYTQVGGEEYKRQGTGLGLAICKALTERMGGTIEASSTAGRGSRFSFSIPAPSLTQGVKASAPDADLRGVVGYRRSDGGQTPLRILVTDDHEHNRLVLAGLLQPLGFEVSQAEGGEAALAACHQDRPDLVLMDLVMPELDGLATTRRLRQQHPELPVIAVSARAYQEDREKSRAAGCVEHIAKPVRLEELLGVLQRHLPLSWQRPAQDDANTAEAPARAAATAPEEPPREALEALQEALLIGQRVRMTAAVEEIAKSAPQLAEQLRQAIERYDYDAVTALID